MVVDSHVSEKKGKPVGAILKEARETLGLRLDDAARVTRIGKGYLQALEDGMFDRLPNDVYAKGFLRAYATYLKLPENEIIHLYEKDISDGEAHTEDPEPLNDRPSDGKKLVPPMGRRFYFIGFLLVGAAVACYFLTDLPFFKERTESVTIATPPEIKPEGHVAPPKQDVGVEKGITEPGAADENHEEPAEEDHVAIPAAATGLVLKIKVIEDGWLDITIDDTISQHYDLKAGDLIEWKGEKSFTLDIGNSGGLEAELNGKPLKSFGEKGETTHVVLKTGTNGR
jgi:cytoskeleton protein RodZ